jgi:putative membrane protein
VTGSPHSVKHVPLDSDGSDPAPAEARGRRLHPATPFLRAWVLVVATAASVFQSVIHSDRSYLALGAVIGAGLVVGLVLGFTSWFFTRYVIDGTELRIDSGILTKRSRRVPYERLQSVDIMQPFAARMFAMAELKIEMAGSGEHDTKLAFLPLVEAERLRQILLERRPGDQPTTDGRARTDMAADPNEAVDADDAVVPDRSAPDPRPHRSPGPSPTTMTDESVLYRVAPLTLAASVALTTEFLVPVGLLSVAIGVGIAFHVVVAMLPVIGPIALGVAQVTSKRLVSEWGFELRQTARGLRLARGLLGRTTQTVPLDRVQGIAIAEPLLWRPAGWCRVEVSVAGHARSGDRERTVDRSTLLPVADLATAARVVADVIPAADVGLPHLDPAPRSARWLRPVGWRFLGVAATNDLIVTRRGWLLRRTSMVPHVKAQSVRLRQGPVQRRLGLATVHVDTPPGPVDAVAMHRAPTQARRLALNELEAARRARAIRT